MIHFGHPDGSQPAEESQPSAPGGCGLPGPRAGNER